MNIIREHNLKRIAEQSISSSASMVSVDGKIVWHDVCGYSDYETKEPLRKNAMFRLASMTKPVTGAAVMLQFDRGIIDLDDKVSKYIPSFSHMKIGKYVDGKAVFDRYAEHDPIIRDLLTHTSGIGSGQVGDCQLLSLFPSDSVSLCDVIPNVGNTLLDFEPGSSSAYSPILAFDTLAYITELTSDMPYPDFLKKYIFDPLEIDDMTYTPTEEQWARVPEIYAATPDGLSRVDMGRHIFGIIPLTYTSGGAGLLGSLESYFKFASMLLDGGGILSERAVSLMRTPYRKMNEHESWGLSMRVITSDNHTLPKGSYGWSGAYGTHFWLDPSNSAVAVYCSNMTTAGGSGAATAAEFERDVMRYIK